MKKRTIYDICELARTLKRAPQLPLVNVRPLQLKIDFGDAYFYF